MPAESVAQVFNDLLPGRVRDKPDLITKVNTIYKFIITGDGGGTWVVDLTQPGGAITAGDSDAKCTITMAAPAFLDLINRKLNPQMAFMTGKLKVAGDMSLALKLGALIA